MTPIQRGGGRGHGTIMKPLGAQRRYGRRTAVLASAAAIAVLAACQDSVVPFFTAPTSIPNSPTGFQQATDGLFSGTRIDMFQVAMELSAYGREAANFTNTEPRFITYDLGIAPTPIGAWFTTWENEYQDIRRAQQLLIALPTIVPAYTAPQEAALKGVIQTIEAYNYLIIAWMHDSLGVAVMQSPNATTVPPIYCLQDGMKYIVALLDSANDTLNVAGATPFPFKLPPGFGAVGKTAGPSTVAGSFASFNRALAAKAGLELAYAIAHQTGGTAVPTPGASGTPDMNALQRADSAALASALYNPAALAPNPPGEWAYDNQSVLWDFSSSSGDQGNPINSIINTQAVLQEVPNVQDTVNDLRWKAKLALNPNPVGQQAYNFVASRYIYGMYPSPNSPLPIIRNETLVLVRAQIQLGLGNFATAMTLANNVRTQVGGLPPAAAAGYVPVRNAVMHEQQMSTLMEAGGDRVIAIRMYGLPTVADTTWNGTPYNPDVHTTVNPISQSEYAGRGGTITLACP